MGVRGGCENPNCCASTGIHGGLTFGSGKLDTYGYWEYPCARCARAFEKLHPEDAPCWPFELDVLDAHCRKKRP
jgi:hypothetical protein